MIEIDFEVAVVSVAIIAFCVGICMFLHNVMAAPKSLRKWRIVMASGCVLSLIGSLLGLARMVTSWHPLSGDLCMLLVVGGGLVDLVAAAMYLSVAPDNGSNEKRASWPWPR
ncbi:hypothetical protein [Ralstonia insidiosa]|jgi:hypothetical protein|nr:hypothetical protein [Ralstonia insidiosa]MBA9939907.1 hypothetical protein [Ralstonia insidiosa]MBC9968568.1 hypothetical protein [Ralstonia insidiosa]MBX3904611.1 hypothetical protein [Ralstonia insidiosa]